MNRNGLQGAMPAPCAAGQNLAAQQTAGCPCARAHRASCVLDDGSRMTAVIVAVLLAFSLAVIVLCAIVVFFLRIIVAVITEGLVTGLA